MFCPYPDCNGQIPEADYLVYCGSCGQPSFFCPHCREPNRSMARHCHHCGRQVALSASQVLPVNGLAQRQVPPVRLGDVNRLCPELTPFGGYLWGVSYYGDVYRLGRGGERLKRCCDLPGSGFEYQPLADADDERGPLLYINDQSRLYRFNMLSWKYEEVFGLEEERRTFASGVVKAKKHYCFLSFDEARSAAALRCVGPEGWEYSLKGLTLPESPRSPLRRIGDALWVFTREKLLVFPQFSPVGVKELNWRPWRIFPSETGVWYTEKVQAGNSGEVQRLRRAGFEGQKIQEFYDQEFEALPLTTRVAADASGEQAAAFFPQTIKLLNSGMIKLRDTVPMLEISNPECVLLSPSVVFWFEAGERTLKGWPVGTNRVWSLWSFDRPVSFSRFIVNDRCLYGLTGEEIWQWDLSG